MSKILEKKLTQEEKEIILSEKCAKILEEEESSPAFESVFEWLAWRETPEGKKFRNS